MISLEGELRGLASLWTAPPSREKTADLTLAGVLPTATGRVIGLGLSAVVLLFVVAAWLYVS